MKTQEQPFNLIIDINNSIKGEIVMAIMETFKIDFYRYTNDKHEVKAKGKELTKLKTFLTKHGITFVENICGYKSHGSFIIMDIIADIYLNPLHHIELRQKDLT